MLSSSHGSSPSGATAIRRKLPASVHPVIRAHWSQPKCFNAMADYLATSYSERGTPGQSGYSYSCCSAATGCRAEG